MRSKKMSKVEKMRKLFKEGKSMYRISKILECRPQMVRNMLLYECKKVGWKGLIEERKKLE